MSEVLIEQLYSPDNCKAIRKLYKEDSTVHNTIRNAIGTKIILDTDKLLTSNPIDVLYLMCLTAKFANSDDECYRIAITVYQYHNKLEDILPSITNDCGLQFATKTLIALSFRAKAMEKKWKRYGAPSPSYYRQTSKQIFKKYNQKDIANNHEKWEGFLGEVFV